MLSKSGQETMMEWPEVVREFAGEWPEVECRFADKNDVASSDSETSETNRGVELPVLSPAVKDKYDAFWRSIRSSVDPQYGDTALQVKDNQACVAFSKAG